MNRGYQKRKYLPSLQHSLIKGNREIGSKPTTQRKRQKISVNFFSFYQDPSNQNDEINSFFPSNERTSSKNITRTPIVFSPDGERVLLRFSRSSNCLESTTTWLEIFRIGCKNTLEPLSAFFHDDIFLLTQDYLLLKFGNGIVQFSHFNEFIGLFYLDRFPLIANNECNSDVIFKGNVISSNISSKPRTGVLENNRILFIKKSACSPEHSVNVIITIIQLSKTGAETQFHHEHRLNIDTQLDQKVVEGIFSSCLGTCALKFGNQHVLLKIDSGEDLWIIDENDYNYLATYYKPIENFRFNKPEEQKENLISTIHHPHLQLNLNINSQMENLVSVTPSAIQLQQQQPSALLRNELPSSSASALSSNVTASPREDYHKSTMQRENHFGLHNIPAFMSQSLLQLTDSQDLLDLFMISSNDNTSKLTQTNESE
jgi:hypothetical protein